MSACASVSVRVHECVACAQHTHHHRVDTHITHTDGKTRYPVQRNVTEFPSKWAPTLAIAS